MKGVEKCHYGCGKEGKYKFKNGKWCCSKSVASCPGYIKKRIGQTRSVESRQRMAKAQKGHIPWNKGKKTGQNNWLGKHHSSESKNKIGSANRLTIEKIRSRYPFFSKIEELRYNPNKDTEIQARCKNHSCPNSKGLGGWFTPKYTQLYERIRQLESPAGIGRGHLYCSKLCKQKGITYYQQSPIDTIKEKYPTFAKIEEIRYNPDKPNKREIQVHCKNHNCKNSKEQGGWFTPKRQAITDRCLCIESENGNGGSYFYCSNNCKQQCPLYGKNVTQLIREDQIRAGDFEDPWYNSMEYQTWRDQVFKLDDKKCVWCNKEATIAHHILPKKTHPELSLDPENGLSCCQECHHKYGHKDECSTGNLSRLVCGRIYRVKKRNHVK